MHEVRRSPLATLFHIPSFYGACTWGAWLFLYLLRLVRLNPVLDLSLAIFLAVEICFIAATLVAYPSYRDLQFAGPSPPAGWGSVPGKPLLLALHALGFAGLGKYLYDLAGYFGGPQFLWVTFLSDAPSIRGNIDIPSSIGIQVAYFGWIAIALTAYAYVRGTLSRKWLVLAGFQYLGNCLYLARTQPIWILFTTGLTLLPLYPSLHAKRMVKRAAATVLLMAVVFWAGAEVTGKTYQEGILEDAKIGGMSQVVYAYGVSGFAYWNHMLQINERPSYSMERLLYPWRKLMARFGGAEEPPSQILEFYPVPFDTNVGTFLEPLYRDGGMWFVVLGSLVYSFGLNGLGRFLLKARTPLALYAWSNLCFTAFIAFVVPKISSFPLWVFVGAGVSSSWISLFRETMKNAAQNIPSGMKPVT